MSRRLEAKATPGGSFVDFYSNGLNTGRRMKLIANTTGCGMELYDGSTLIGAFTASSSGNSNLVTRLLNGLAISWRPNGDGTYTLVGSEMEGL